MARSKPEIQGELSLPLKIETQREKLQDIIAPGFGFTVKLYCCKVLTDREKSRIDAEKTTFDKNKLLLDFIFKSGKCEEFVQALRESGQTHVANWIEGNGVYKHEFGKEWPLREKQLEFLGINFENLIEVLDTEHGFLDKLLSKKAINARQMEYIRKKSISFECNEAFLEILKQSSVEAYNLTIKCLRESNQEAVSKLFEEGGALLPIHATLEGDSLDEVEEHIVNEVTKCLENIPSLENIDEDRLLARIRSRIIAVKKGKSIVLFVSCCTVEEFQYLCAMVDNGKMKKILEKLFNLILQKLQTEVLLVAIYEFDREYAKKLFQRELLRDKKYDEHSQRLSSQLKYDPMELTTRESVEEIEKTELPHESEDPSTSASVKAAEDEAFEMFIENKTGQLDFNVEYNKAYDEAFVMFRKLTLSASEIISRIQQAPLMDTSLAVEKTSSKHRIVVTNITPNVDEQLLELYFDSTKMNPLGDTILVDFDSSYRAAIITYSGISAMDTVLSADHSRVLGSDALVQRCESYFDSLSNYASVDDEADSETSSCVGSTATDDQAFDGSEDVTETYLRLIQVSGKTGFRGRGRKRRGRGGRGGRLGNRRGKPGFGDGGQRTSSVSSVKSERRYEERSRGGGEGESGNTRRGRGGQAVVDGWWSCDVEGGRPPSGRGRGGEHLDSSTSRGQRRGGRQRPPYAASISSTSDEHDNSNAGRGNQGGNHPSSRRSHRTNNQRSWRGMLNQKTGSAPNLLQDPIPLGSIRKEVDVKNEVKNEKCQLLTTMLREIKTQNRCSAFIEMQRHRVVLVGQEAVVNAAVEDVNSRLCAMHSVRLDLAPAFARKLDTRDGHHQLIEFFKNAQIRAIYYTDAERHPMVIGADESAATSAVDYLMCRIKTEEIGYDDRHKLYLSSADWTDFASSVVRDRLLAIEITPRSSILVIGIANDVEVVVDSVQSQLSTVLAQPPVSGPKSSSVDSQRRRPARVHRSNAPQEPRELCPICGVSFPPSVIAAHADQCMEDRRCSICDEIFSESFGIEEFQSHVDSHFL